MADRKPDGTLRIVISPIEEDPPFPLLIELAPEEQRDPLTGLLTHPAMASIKARSTLVLLDIDDLSRVNYEHGHRFSDPITGLDKSVTAAAGITQSRGHELKVRVSEADMALFCAKQLEVPFVIYQGLRYLDGDGTWQAVPAGILNG